MKILWICGLPAGLLDEAPECRRYYSNTEWSWVLGHLPPPEGVDLHIACPVTAGSWKTYSFTYQGANFHLVRCPRGRLQTGYLLDPFFFRPLFQRIRPLVVHGWGTEDSNSIIAQSLAPRSSVVQVQGLLSAYLGYLPSSIRLRYVAMRERMTLRRANDVFVESQYSREISSPYCSSGARISQIDHPLRDEFLKAIPSQRSCKQVLFLARLTDPKGYLDAVAAFAATPTDWNMVMIGDGPKESVARLEMRVDALGLRNRFRRIARAEACHIVEHMRNSSIYLLPSYMDTGPTSLKEAIAMNLWPVCYNNSGPAELVNRFEVGMLCSTGDVEALQSALLSAVSKVRTHTTTNVDAWIKARKAFSKESIWPKLLEAYSSIITRNAAAAYT